MGADAAPFGKHRGKFRAARHALGLAHRFRQDGKVFLLEFVRALGSTFARQESGQSFSVEKLARHIVDRSREPEGFHRLDHGAPALFYAAKHLVFDLDQIVRIEEGAAATEKRVHHRVGMGMCGALSLQGLLAVCLLTRSLCHPASLANRFLICLDNYVYYIHGRQAAVRVALRAFVE